MNEFQPGDVVEIKTKTDLAYVQVTHRHASYPEVVRALPGLFQDRPDNLDDLAAQPSVFTAMIPLGGAIARGALAGEKVAQADIPARDQIFPTFRMAIRDKHGDIAYWWFWDGDGLRYDEHPGGETEDYPLREVLTVSAFLGRLAAAN
ncbi:hypothetical protein FF80_01015 [Devosia sp. LC5]|jgi:hypothetical protein|uniref:hypothetical protein n=1 Tax=Devosiaceae TaxID=2831106 RepID=UPI0004E40B1E|nr:hypothetical protein [Devosia sp. LC5]KFC70233.1 hypothetical protein FF80_01015 [Devosia sp. LC5]MBN13904.1 hypothetical protein [Pelagibacterium sp.]|tara:strand:- start:369 stop:812 length:444 start_codon:yes stop_codon:yes gene_type:complete